jgi:GTP-binding protein EngB required for normal cell division
MRGYGSLDSTQVQELEGVIAELRGRLEALLRELTPEPAAQLEVRIAQLLPSPARELLAGLEQITRERGLMEFRAGLSLAAERLGAPAMEVAVFGRVSCGKSSLLNYLLGADLLPTGATPITAVPTRVGFGPEPALIAQFARDQQTFPAEQLREQLAALASEQQNPDNRLGVTRLTVQYPSPRLREGVLFVDTPGLGSIRSWGAMETLAYLPRSDMAILLIDAGSTLGDDERELVRWLHQGGVPVQVLLSKADLVSPAELERGLDFTRQALARETEGGVRVRAVSVRRPEMADAWFEQDIFSLYAALRRRFQAALDRRLEVLRAAILEALHVTSGEAEMQVDAEAAAGLERRFRLADATADRAADLFRGFAHEVADSAAVVIAEVAAALAEGWNGDPPLDNAGLRALAGEALGRAMVAHSRPGLEILTELAQAYTGVLTEARRVLPRLDPDPSAPEFSVRDLPMPEVGPVAWDISRPRLAVGRKLLTGHFRRVTEAHGQEIAAALRAYGVLLQQRGQAARNDMARQFAARADVYRAALLRLSGKLAAEAPAAPELSQRLRDIQAWQPAGTATEGGAG